MSGNQPLGSLARVASAWRVIVPIKHRGVAKSRLIAPDGVSRSQVAQAMARDTVQAAAATVGPGALTVVTSDERMAAWALSQGMTVLPDPGHGLNAAVTLALSGLAGSHVAVLLGDLPALRPEDLEVALAACGRHRMAFVPDRGGTGTCLLTSTLTAAVPHFGPDSARRHERVLGATALHLALPRLRHDVDTAADLTGAVALGVGRHTRRALAGSSTTKPDTLHRP